MYKNNDYPFMIRQFALTDFKLRYNASILGYFWSLLNPLLQFGVLFLIFSVFLRFDVPYYALYLLLGIVVWNFLVEATNNAMNSVLGKASLIRKMNFPRQIIVVASNITSAISFMLNFFVVLLFIIVSGVNVNIALLSLFFPIYVILLLLLVTGLSFLLSALYARFRDIKHLWNIFLQLGFWLTPIVYPLTLVPEQYRLFFNLNPMHTVISSMREILIYGKMPELFPSVVLAVSALTLLFTGYLLFRNMSEDFAEYV